MGSAGCNKPFVLATYMAQMLIEMKFQIHFVATELK